MTYKQQLPFCIRDVGMRILIVIRFNNAGRLQHRSKYRFYVTPSGFDLKMGWITYRHPVKKIAPHLLIGPLGHEVLFRAITPFFKACRLLINFFTSHCRNCQLSTVNCQLSTVNCQLSTVNRQPSTFPEELLTFINHSPLSFLKNIHHSSDSDLELVEKYKQSGDLEILAVLYQRYMDLVYGVCLKYLKDQEKAKDAVMQIFEELVQKLYKYEIANFKSWLYTLAKHFCLMQLRTPRTLKTVELDPAIMQSEEEKHLNGVMQKEEEFKRLEKCLQTLSGEQKESVELFYLKEKCYKEIAEITGKDWNKVRSLIQNGRRNLKICMDKTE